MSRVEFKAVSMHYDTVAALDDVSLAIEEGEFFGLLGPSGSGKTTLLRAIAGFVVPDAGDIHIGARDLAAVPVHRRDIGMVFQHYALFPHMSVWDNVAFGLSVRRVGGAEVANRVKAMLDLVQLEGLEARRPAQLSGGQQQRVALARALITRPQVLLLDEPLGALDKRLRQQMQVELRQIQREIGTTTVFVTHDQEEALTLSDRIALLDAGRIVQVGTPRDVYERPRTAFAAQFLGDANFFTGRLAPGSDAATRIRLEPGIELRASEPPPDSARPVTLAVRPEKLDIVAAGSHTPPGNNVLAGRVTQSVYAGSSVTYRISTQAGSVTVFEQSRGSLTFELDNEVVLSWSPEHTVVLSV